MASTLTMDVLLKDGRELSWARCHRRGARLTMDVLLKDGREPPPLPAPHGGRTSDIYFDNSRKNGILQSVRAFRPERKERNKPMQTPLPPSKEKNGKTKPRLTPGERLRIENLLDDGCTPYRIARTLGRPPKTILREIDQRAKESTKGVSGRPNNRCVHRYDCPKRNSVCRTCLHTRRSMLCRFCRQCNAHCPDFIEQHCERLASSPFVCNGCRDTNKCPLRKRFYVADEAQKNYKTILAKAREGVNITEEELSARPRGQDAVRPVHAEVRPGSRGPLQQPADSGERNRPQAEIHLAAGVINNCDLLRFPRQREYHQVPRSPRLLGRPRRPFD